MRALILVAGAALAVAACDRQEDVVDQNTGEVVGEVDDNVINAETGVVDNNLVAEDKEDVDTNDKR